MVDDVTEAREAMLEFEPLQVHQQAILFDPKVFQEANSDPKIDDYALGEAILLEWAVRTTKIRLAIKDKIAEAEREQPDQQQRISATEQLHSIAELFPAGDRSRRGL